ncbi:MAG: DUF2510 domain-containing protein [Demequina sp.]|nr:DUF2510 domain-containing protein [Demequina sp.]
MKQPTLGAQGWYPDPHVDGFERFWDGAAWTSRSRPRQGRGSGSGRGAGGRVGIIVAIVAVAVVVGGVILAFFAFAAKPAVEQQANLVDSGQERAYDAAAMSDAGKLGQQLATYYADHEGAPPAVTVVNGRYVFAGDATLGPEPVSDGVALGGVTGTGATDWCVWVTTAATTPSPWQVSAAGGLAAGDCG